MIDGRDLVHPFTSASATLDILRNVFECLIIQDELAYEDLIETINNAYIVTDNVETQDISKIDIIISKAIKDIKNYNIDEYKIFLMVLLHQAISFNPIYPNANVMAEEAFVKVMDKNMIRMFRILCI